MIVKKNIAERIGQFDEIRFKEQKFIRKNENDKVYTVNIAKN